MSIITIVLYAYFPIWSAVCWAVLTCAICGEFLPNTTLSCSATSLFAVYDFSSCESFTVLACTIFQCALPVAALVRCTSPELIPSSSIGLACNANSLVGDSFSLTASESNTSSSLNRFWSSRRPTTFALARLGIYLVLLAEWWHAVIVVLFTFILPRLLRPILSLCLRYFAQSRKRWAYSLTPCSL